MVHLESRVYERVQYAKEKSFCDNENKKLVINSRKANTVKSEKHALVELVKIKMSFYL